MKKIDIIQTTLIIIGVLNAYHALYGFISMLAEIPLASGLDIQQALIEQLVFTGLVTAGVFLIIRYSRQIAGWLLKFDREGDAEASARWNVDRRTLIFALFVGIGIFILIQALPNVLEDLFYEFKNKVSRHAGLFAPKDNFLLLQCLKMALGALIVYIAPELTDWIEKTIAVRLKAATPGTVAEAPPYPPDNRPDAQST